MTHISLCLVHTGLQVMGRQARASLDLVGEIHVEVPKLNGGWERNTMAKPWHILDAMARHPDKVIVLLDVDCEARHPLHELAAFQGDIGLHMRCKFGKGGLPWLGARSGTIVLRPTAAARAFAHNWMEINRAAPKDCVDQRTLPKAIAETSGLAVDNLDVKFCAVAADKVADPVILHDSASRDTAKINNWVRRIYAVFGIKSDDVLAGEKSMSNRNKKQQQAAAPGVADHYGDPVHLLRSIRVRHRRQPDRHSL